MPRPTVVRLWPLLCLVAPATADGHGGQYTRPRVPLGPVTGVDPADAGKFSGTGPGLPPSAVGPSGALRRGETDEADGWRRWWRARAPSLRAERAGADAAGMAGLTGRARDAAADWAPVRALFRRALDAAEIDLVDSAILARGRSASAATADEVFKEIWPYVGHPVESIRRSAVAALGLLPGDRAGPVLVSLLSQPRNTDPVTNGIAAVALGYRSAPEGIGALLRTVDREGPEETRSAAVVALGLYRDARREIVLALTERLADETLPESVRAQLPIALGRLGDEAAPAIPALEETARRDRSEPVRRAAIVALGALVSPEDDDAVRRLVAVADRARTGASRGAALLALGEIARRATPDDARTAAGAGRARAHLLQRLAAPLHAADVGFACLGVARAVLPLDRHHDDRVAATERLERRVGDARSGARADAARGAAAIALGLLGRVEVVEELRERGERTDDPALRADLATALGLLGDRGSIPLLRTWLETSTDFRVREAAIRALGDLSPEIANTILLRRLDASTLPSDRILLVQGLARVGGPSAMPRLIRLADDATADVLTRAFAVVALGRMLEPGPLAWNERLAADGDPTGDGKAVRQLLDMY